MANLQIDQALNAIAQTVKDSDGNSSPLALSADKVGIGTTNPSEQLEIVSDNAAVRILGTGTTRGAAVMKFQKSVTNAQREWWIGVGIKAASDAGFSIYDNGSNSVWMHIDTNGNVAVAGDIRLTGADCAENFDVEEAPALEPGTVMVIGDEEKLLRCTKAYDKRVAGVISGAGECKPGLILGNQSQHQGRLPIGLTGKVYCKVDARFSPIGVGDLLTTSPTPGHAMKADDPLKAFGAVIGKALRPLTDGQGLIPVLIALQ